MFRPPLTESARDRPGFLAGVGWGGLQYPTSKVPKEGGVGRGRDETRYLHRVAAAGVGTIRDSPDNLEKKSEVRSEAVGQLEPKVDAGPFWSKGNRKITVFSAILFMQGKQPCIDEPKLLHEQEGEKMQ